MPKDETIEKIIALIFLVGRSIRRQASTGIYSCPLSILQIETLRFVRENKRVLMKDLADYLHIAPPSATSIADDLVEGKLVRRLDDRRDRRITKISMTAKGKRMLENSLRKKIEGFRKKIEILSSSEKKSLLKILKKLSEEEIGKL